MNRFITHSAGVIAALALICGTAVASAGHDHDHGAKAPVAAGPASPRFEAHSDLFEVIGVLQGEELAVFVDHYADNAPVLKAKVELESGAMKVVGQFHEDHGDYRFAAAVFKKPGSYPITLTVSAGDEMDILAGNLVIPDAHSSQARDDRPSPLKRIGLGAIALIALLTLIQIVRRLQKRRPVKGPK